MLTALGYQPRTTSTNLLFIRLILIMPPTVRYGVDGTRRLPLSPHEICLHRTPYNIHDSLACLDYPLQGDSCQAAFYRVTSAYSPKRLTTKNGTPGVARKQATLGRIVLQLYNIGTEGFEPSATRFQSEDSDQAELRPVINV